MDIKDSKYGGCLYHSASALGRIITKMAEEEFALTGMSPSYAYLVLGVIDKPGIQPKELSEQLQLTPSTVTRLVEKMELKGYVERKSVGRTTEIFPTAKCKKLHKQIKKAWMNLYDRYCELLGEKKASQLTNAVFEATQKLDV